tara:strand:+ start:9578 stop:10798 length:1221 start_codon:yes stop_codon:yes gene_type:complete
MNCRHCQHTLEYKFVDLGSPPPSNAYIEPNNIDKPENTFPLRVYVCEHCWLVQTDDFVQAETLFSPSYAYFSSTSTSWLSHAELFVEKIIERQHLDENSFVIEIASNDGYLLKNFVQAQIPCLGIEPTKATAEASRALNIPVLERFFSEDLAIELVNANQTADLVIGNNVLAHVPNINDFVAGLNKVLKPRGIITMEFPHLQKLIEFNQFDTIYHEHFSYLSLHAVMTIFNHADLTIFDVEEITTHGGSLRIYACKNEAAKAQMPSVSKILNTEKEMGLTDLSIYTSFQLKIEKIKSDLLFFLQGLKQKGFSVAGYGAAAKGNTLLNYAQIKADLLPCIYDAAESKQGKLMPGSHIPILSPELLKTNQPDYLIIFPWNIKTEIQQQLDFLTHSKIVIAIPNIEVVK